MSLEYLSGLAGAKRKAKKSRPSAEERREVIKQRQAENKASGKVSKLNPNKKMSAGTKIRVNKLQVQSKIRKAFVKKAEPIKVEEEEIKEEQEQPADFQASEETPETTPEETQAEEQAEEQAEVGIYYPEISGRKSRKSRPSAEERRELIKQRQAENRTNGKVSKFRKKNEVIGMYYPESIGKIKIKVPKLKGKLKQAVQKAKQRLKDDKHKPAEKVAHQLAKQALFIPRGAFLAIMLLGKALEKSPIKINIGKKVAEVWDKKNKDIKEFWYKVGGEPDILEKQIKKFKSSKISGYLGVEPTTTAAAGSITAAAPLIAKFLKIVGKAKECADKNPKMLAAGQALVKKGIEQVAQKNPDKLQSINKVADEITKVLPPEQQAKINKIRTAIPKSTTDKIIKQAVTETKGIKQTTGTTPTETPAGNKNKMLLIGGGAVALIGAYMLMKKKK
jgi:hypothetical protein